MPEFLELLPPEDALLRLLKALPASQPPAEKIRTADALGRVSAVDLLAPEPLPGFDRSTVDGYAVCAADTFGASDSLPAFIEVAGEVPMGGAPGFALQRGQAALIHTGGMLPDGADAVVMLEHTQPARSNEIEVLRAVAVGENVLKTGEDVRPGEIVVPAGRILRPAEIGGLLALGITEIQAACKPVIGVLSSGDEVVPPDQPVQPGQVRDVNSFTLAALIESAGGLARRFGIVPDRREELERSLSKALEECAAVVITAGSSASSRDLTAEVIQQMGSPGVLVHGVNVRPGKPTILAVCDGKAVIGLPGNPVSALVIAGLFVVPLVRRLLGITGGQAEVRLQARLAVNLPSQAGRVDYVPVRLIPGPEGWLAEPIFYKSNLILTLAKADGLACIPADATGLAAGDLVEVALMR
jgi:molybdopterin molybdotransferase